MKKTIKKIESMIEEIEKSKELLADEIYRRILMEGLKNDARKFECKKHKKDVR